MAFFNDEEPLGLPRGSVRALLAIGVVAAFIFVGLPAEVATLVLGFYFASRPTE